MHASIPLALLLLVCVCLAGAQDTLNGGDALKPGGALHNGAQLSLILQGDGNTVLYCGSTALFNTGTAGRGAPDRLAMQTDGNLVLYGAGGAVWWQTGTSGHGSAPYRLVLQSDANVVLYDAASMPLWQTGTAGQCGGSGPTPPPPPPPPPPPSPGGHRRVTLWVYGNIITGGQLDGTIAAMQAHVASFNAVSYQCYGVGDDGSFQANHPGGVPDNAAQAFRTRLGGVQVWAMISAGTNYAPFDALFGSAQAQENFIQAAIGEAHAKGIDGYNVDWEVSGQWATDPHCHDTIAFLATFSSRLGAASPPIGVSIDIPGGSSVCSAESTRMLAAMPATRLITMGTYSCCGSPTVGDFNRFLVDGMAAFGSKFGVGMDAVDAPYLSTQDLQKEFLMATEAGVAEIAVWFFQSADAIKEPWWSLMSAFKNAGLALNATNA